MGSKEEESQQNEPREKSKTTEKPANSQVIKCEMTLKTLEQLEKLPMRSKWRHVLQRLYVESHLEVLDMQDSGVTLEVIRCLYDYLSYINTPLIHLK
jgi:Fe-S cluster assembly ATPase SufC